MAIQPAKIWRSLRDKYQLPQTGTLLSWTGVHVAPESFESQVPYLIAVVEFPDQKRQMVQLTDCEEGDLKAGMAVEAMVRRYSSDGDEGVINYGIKYRPARK